MIPHVPWSKTAGAYLMKSTLGYLGSKEGGALRGERLYRAFLQIFHDSALITFLGIGRGERLKNLIMKREFSGREKSGKAPDPRNHWVSVHVQGIVQKRKPLTDSWIFEFVHEHTKIPISKLKGEARDRTSKIREYYVEENVLMSRTIRRPNKGRTWREEQRKKKLKKALGQRTPKREVPQHMTRPKKS